MANGDRWRRLLGGRDSWRRVVLGGAAVGVTLAFVAALIAGLVNVGGGGSLGPETPTGVPAPIGGGYTEIPEATPTEVLVPTEPLPTELEPTLPLEPTETPFVEPTETFVPEEPTPTFEAAGAGEG